MAAVGQAGRGGADERVEAGAPASRARWHGRRRRAGVSGAVEVEG
jgi:hypothetical protein